MNSDQFTAKEKVTLFRMLLIGESVLGMLEDYRGKRGNKYDKLMDKVYSHISRDEDVSNLVTKEGNQYYPNDNIDTKAFEELDEYDDHTFFENLATKLGQRDFTELAPKAELKHLEEKKYFPPSISRYIDSYYREFASAGIYYLRFIPPDLLADFQSLLKSRKACFLCGKTKNLVKTECCNQWICDDEDKYELFSYSAASCHRNHRRFTLCSHHQIEGHAGKWQNCKKCLADFDTEMYVYYGTNGYNYQFLSNPPDYEPTHCDKCKRIISRGYEGYTSLPKGKFLCESCAPDFTQPINNQE